MTDDKVLFGIKRYEIRSDGTGNGWGVFIISTPAYSITIIATCHGASFFSMPNTSNVFSIP